MKVIQSSTDERHYNLVIINIETGESNTVGFENDIKVENLLLIN